MLIAWPVQNTAQGSGGCTVLSLAACGFLSMGDSSALGVGQEGLATPTVLGIEHLLIAPLLKEFVDVFHDPVFPTDIHITHDIDLIDPMS